MTSQQIRSDITAKIITALEAGTIPWRRPWRVSPNSGRPASVSTGKPYSGVNPLLLELHRMQFGFLSKWWLTFRQAEALGCRVQPRPSNVKPGQWGCHVVFYRPVEKTTTDPQTGEEKDEKFFILKTYCVFNVDQCNGAAIDKYRVIDPPDTGVVLPNFQPIDDLIRATGADIRFGGQQAFYRRPTPEGSFPQHTAGDFIQMPLKARFKSVAGYYESILHELGHWSEVRTGWDSKAAGYPLSELAAEMSCCFVASELGIPGSDDLTNHAAYIQSWLQAMRNDPKFIFKASTQASKVCDFLMSFVRQPVVSPQAVEEEAA